MLGVIRNAVNFPPSRVEEMLKLRPYLALAEQLGALGVQLAEGRTKGIGVRLLRPAGRPRTARSSSAPRWPACFGRCSHRRHGRERPRHRDRARHRDRRVAQLAGAELRQHHLGEAPHQHRRTLAGGHGVRAGAAAADARSTASRSRRRSKARCSSSATTDKPGVIGEVGTILGRHGVNIASFALGRDEPARSAWSAWMRRPMTSGLTKALPEIRAAEAVREARVARLAFSWNCVTLTSGSRVDARSSVTQREPADRRRSADRSARRRRRRRP